MEIYGTYKAFVVRGDFELDIEEGIRGQIQRKESQSMISYKLPSNSELLRVMKREI